MVLTFFASVTSYWNNHNAHLIVNNIDIQAEIVWKTIGLIQ